jgi:hypothetical protein
MVWEPSSSESSPSPKAGLRTIRSGRPRCERRPSTRVELGRRRERSGFPSRTAWREWSRTVDTSPEEVAHLRHAQRGDHQVALARPECVDAPRVVRVGAVHRGEQRPLSTIARAGALSGSRASPCSGVVRAGSCGQRRMRSRRAAPATGSRPTAPPSRSRSARPGGRPLRGSDDPPLPSLTLLEAAELLLGRDAALRRYRGILRAGDARHVIVVRPTGRSAASRKRRRAPPAPHPPRSGRAPARPGRRAAAPSRDLACRRCSRRARAPADREVGRFEEATTHPSRASPSSKRPSSCSAGTPRCGAIAGSCVPAMPAT